MPQFNILTDYAPGSDLDVALTVATNMGLVDQCNLILSDYPALWDLAVGPFASGEYGSSYNVYLIDHPNAEIERQANEAAEQVNAVIAEHGGPAPLV